MEVFVTTHQRKARIYKLGDGYLALPGGYGTLDELFETLSGTQIGLHAKPVGLLNVNGYFDPLLEMLDQAETIGFLFPEQRRDLLCSAEPDALIDLMTNYTLPTDTVQRRMRQTLPKSRSCTRSGRDRKPCGAKKIKGKGLILPKANFDTST